MTAASNASTTRSMALRRKRKANGKQKEYEERTKAKKKAEIEARKAAIRTEDIAKGVFIPVSSLPKREPQKGAKTA